MTRKILVAAIVLFVCSAASANCMRETFGATICGQGPCANGQDGRVYCAAERDGTAVMDSRAGLFVGLAGASKTSFLDR